MRILWLLPQLPYPPDTGGKQDPLNMMRVFAELGDDITAGIVYFKFKDKPVIPPEFAALVCDTFWIPGNPQSKVAQLFGSLSDPVPFNFRRYYSEEGVGIVADAMSAKPSFDAVIIDHFHLGQLTLDAREKLKEKGIQPPKLVLRTPNVESNIVTRYAEKIDNVLVKTFAQKEASKMKPYEAKTLPEFDLVAAITPVDRDTFISFTKKPVNIISVTAGVDIDEIKPSDEPPVRGEVAFVGTFDWQPNVDGALWMINKVWPRILKKVPDAHLSIVGRNPPPYLVQKGSESITITGKVDSVAEYVRRASCIAVPLWIGSGMRLKILEAFAHGRAVVSTSLGAEGIEAVNGEHIVIADKPDDFALSVVEILTNGEKRDSIGRNARKLAEEKYSWDKVSNELREAVLDLIRQIKKS